VEDLPASVLIIDDERNVREMLDFGLTSHGFAVKSVQDGLEALRCLRENEFDAIVCDVMLPKIDGLNLLPQLRRLTEAPIIMLSAKGDVEDRITGLQNGADDYMAKPFALDELIARLQTALRRPQLKSREVLRYLDLEMDLQTHAVKRGDRLIDLSAREFALLEMLMRSPRQVFTREQLLEKVWGSNRDVGFSSVETYISYLRSKIDRGEQQPRIHTIRGVGYSLR
jgi:DNA-binding response OmpR family regulator